MPAGKRVFLDVNGIHLGCVDFGGDGPSILLLHGLAGRGNEWHDTASWLTQRGHVYALDQRGHGRSAKELDDYSRDAYVADAAATVERFQLAPVLLIGQSMGGLNAFLVAARHPDLVRALIVVEARPSPNTSAQRDVEKWLNSWPLPFSSLADAQVYFGGDTLYAQTWLEMLEERDDGFWSICAQEEMVRSMADLVTADYWPEWDRIACPTLVVCGENGHISQDERREMAGRIPHGRYVQISQAGHDLHLDRPDLWRQAVEAFLDEVVG
jgi:pimeloyl-ACP methyl ester carboxylesterase